MNIILFIGFYLFVFANPVQAYIDPGTGSQIIQIVLAAGFGSLFFAKDIISKVMRKLKESKQKKGEPKNE